ncbi:MAG: CDP-alcohol phosphatidyltransferase family protein [Pseudomonadota bacterium]
MARNKPWDARCAAILVRPFCDSALHPNHFTLLRLVVGLAGAWTFSLGTHPNLGALLVVASNFIDHTDGELARMSGKTSKFGHYFDLASDAIVTVGMFVGIGWGLAGALDNAALYGLISGAAVAAIFQIRQVLEAAHGKSATAQPALGGFESEDILYLMPLVTYFDGLEMFLYAAAVGAPIALLVVAVDFVRTKRRLA